jgi:hypothetical protein
MSNKHSASKSTDSRKSQAVAAQKHAEPDHGLLDHLKEYAREKPEVAALWCLGIGFILGWKLKPW